MTQDAVKALSDGELEQVIGWAQAERKMRADRRKHETIVKIRELAQSVGISINLSGMRGRPARLHESQRTSAKVKP
jgi:hypothetical protein